MLVGYLYRRWSDTSSHVYCVVPHIGWAENFSNTWGKGRTMKKDIFQGKIPHTLLHAHTHSSADAVTMLLPKSSVDPPHRFGLLFTRRKACPQSAATHQSPTSHPWEAQAFDLKQRVPLPHPWCPEFWWLLTARAVPWRSPCMQAGPEKKLHVLPWQTPCTRQRGVSRKS